MRTPLILEDAEVVTRPMQEARGATAGAYKGPSAADAGAYERRAARFTLGVALIQLVYLAWPAHLLFQHTPGAGGTLPTSAALVSAALLYTWASWRVCMRRETLPALLGAGVLTVLGVALPFAYGPAVFGFTFYAAVLLALALPIASGLLGVAAVAIVTAVMGVVVSAPFAQVVSITLLAALMGVVVLAVSRLLATTRELLLAREEIRRLAAGEERLRLARDLHDAVKQQVFVAAMEVGAARALWEREPPAAAAHLDEADTAIREAQHELSGIIGDLRPRVLSDRSLAAALRQQVTEWSRRHEVPAALRIDGDPRVAPEAGDALFRAAQEALANAARHSGARHVRVGMASERETVVLTVADDGRGFAPGLTTPGHGLAGMRERLEALGGSVTVTSEPGGGTEVVCVSPAEPTEGSDE